MIGLFEQLVKGLLPSLGRNVHQQMYVHATSLTILREASGCWASSYSFGKHHVSDRVCSEIIGLVYQVFLQPSLVHRWARNWILKGTQFLEPGVYSGSCWTWNIRSSDGLIELKPGTLLRKTLLSTPQRLERLPSTLYRRSLSLLLQVRASLSRRRPAAGCHHHCIAKVHLPTLDLKRRFPPESSYPDQCAPRFV